LLLYLLLFVCLCLFAVQVEQRQYELLELLLATPWPDSTRNSSSSSTTDSSTSSSSSSCCCALLVFLRFLLQKNMYALRDVPPPGLSEPTVLMSAFFALLQMLQPALQAACDSSSGSSGSGGSSGPLAAFPVGELFAGVGAAAEAEPVFNMPRLGGVVTHLAREHPITEGERRPVVVGVIEQQQGQAVLLQQQQQGQQQGGGGGSEGGGAVPSRSAHLQVRAWGGGGWAGGEGRCVVARFVCWEGRGQSGSSCALVLPESFQGLCPLFEDDMGASRHVGVKWRPRGGGGGGINRGG